MHAYICRSYQGMVTDALGKPTSRGTFVIQSFIQEDRVYTPDLRDVITHSPLILKSETGETILMATLLGQGGFTLRRFIQAVQQQFLESILVVDIADRGGPNLKYLRYLLGFLKKESSASDDMASRILFRAARCDGHQFHLTSSVVLTRAAVSSPLFSAALFLRCGTYKWKLRQALDDIIRRGLEFHQGGDPLQENIDYAKRVVQHTILRRFTEENTPAPGTSADKQR